jgi:hypothetical protein
MRAHGDRSIVTSWPLHLQVRKAKDYTPFPPPQQPRKVDLELESGEYFLSKELKAARAAAEKQEAQAAAVAENKRKRQAAFEAPQVLPQLTAGLQLQSSCRSHDGGRIDLHLVAACCCTCSLIAPFLMQSPRSASVL